MQSAVQRLTGSLAPADLVTELQRPVTDTSPRLQLAVLGAHGGAGATTVAALLDPTRSGLAAEIRRWEELAPGRMPIVVARSTAYGMAAAARVLAARPHGPAAPWLVLVADAPTGPPAAVRFQVRALAERLSGVTRVDYVHRLRAIEDPFAALAAPPIARAARRLRRALAVPD